MESLVYYMGEHRVVAAGNGLCGETLSKARIELRDGRAEIGRMIFLDYFNRDDSQKLTAFQSMVFLH